MAAFSPFAFYRKYVSDSSDGEGDFGEDNLEEGSRSFCDKFSKNNCDGSVNESDEESVTDVLISQILMPSTLLQTKILKLLIQFIRFTDAFTTYFVLRPLSDCLVFSVE